MLFCFDIDGTLDSLKMKGEGEYIQGIIPVKTLINLMMDKHDIAIVSPSPYYPEGFESMIYAQNESNDYRWLNIQEAMRYNNVLDEKNVVYVDDLQGNLNLIKKQYPNMTVFTPKQFMEQFK